MLEQRFESVGPSGQQALSLDRAGISQRDRICPGRSGRAVGLTIDTEPRAIARGCWRQLSCRALLYLGTRHVWNVESDGSVPRSSSPSTTIIIWPRFLR